MKFYTKPELEFTDLMQEDVLTGSNDGVMEGTGSIGDLISGEPKPW